MNIPEKTFNAVCVPKHLYRVIALSQKLMVATEDLLEVCGWYAPKFLNSLKRAEADVKAGRTRRIKSLKELG